MEVRNVETSDIPGAFLQTNYYKGYIHIHMKGTMGTLLDKIDPDYYKYFIYVYNREKYICMKNPRSLYTSLYKQRYYLGQKSPKS